MSEPHCFASIEVCALRVARLTAGGAPSPGADDGYRTDALVDAEITVELKAGTDVEQINGCGAVCSALKRPDRIKRAGITLNLCKLDAELLSLLVGGDLFSSAGDTIGWQAPLIDDDDPTPVCIEVWSTAMDGTVQATPPALGGSDPAWFHWVFPNTKFSVGNMTLSASNYLIVPAVGFSDENPNITSNGPWNDWPAAVSGPGGINSSFGFFLDDVLPEAACGFVTLPSGS